jgi:DNA-binding NarL/FixJ family response regulator
LPEIEAMRPDLVIADVCLPEMDGVTMATELRRVNPHARIILISVDKLRTPLPPRHQCADAFVAKAGPGRRTRSYRASAISQSVCPPPPLNTKCLLS